MGRGLNVALTYHTDTLNDGSCESLSYACTTDVYQTVNPSLLNPLIEGPGDLVNASRWQRLELTEFIDQSGIPSLNLYPQFVGPHWGRVTSFSLNQSTLAPGRFAHSDFSVDPEVFVRHGTREYAMNYSAVATIGAQLDVSDNVSVSCSPSNHFLGSNNAFAQSQCSPGTDALCRNIGSGHAFNPITGKPYLPNSALRGDYLRVLAEFWADGPKSETPPGHWFTILATVLDAPSFNFRWNDG